MIQLKEPLIDITMKVEINYPQPQILEFLSQRGYEIKAYRQYLPPTEEILVSEPKLIHYTFTATKQGESQSEDTLYLKVFEREVKALLNDFMKI